MAKPKLVYRIRYDENWDGNGEYVVFESRRANKCGDEWGLDTAYKVIDDRISHEALLKVRQLIDLGIKFYFA